MVQVSRVYNNREKNNVLSVGEGKKSKKCHIFVTERVKHLKIFRYGRKAFKICLNCSFKITYILVSVFGVIWTRTRVRKKVMLKSSILYSLYIRYAWY